MLHGGCHTLLSHNCPSLIDTLPGARQMWVERYILDSERNLRYADAGQMLNGQMQEEALVQEDTETDVAIEDD
jgi:hypothetical protein